MSKNNIKIILFLVAVLIVGASYMYVYKPNMDDKKTLESDIKSLETRLSDLQAKEVHRAEYEAQTAEYLEGFDEIVANFPATLDQEISVMFIKGVEEVHDGEFLVSSVGLGKEASFYTLGGEESEYDCSQAAFPITYQGSYDGIKKFMDYIMDYKYRMNITSVTISYDAENDWCSGSVSLNAYCVNGGGREADKVDVDVPTGVSNLFLGGDAAPTATTYAYDEDNGASIANNYDVKLTLNNANNDATDGIIVATSNSASTISSSENSVETVTLKVYEEDGKNYISYELGGESYAEELASSDVKVYVASAARVDSDDSNGVKLNVENSTNLKVFVKVADDDTSSPRFALGSKTGTVKVY